MTKNLIRTKVRKRIHLCLVLILPFILTTAKSDNTPSLYVAHSGIEESERLFFTNLINNLQKSKPITHTIKQLNTTRLTLAELEKVLSIENSCVLTIGEPALQKVLTTRQTVPIFSTLVSKYNLDNYIENYKPFKMTISGVYQEQSFERQIFLSKALNTNLSKIGVLLGSRTQFSLRDYQKIAASQTVELSYSILRRQASAQHYFKKLPLDDQSVLLVLNDNEQYSVIDLQSLLLASHSKKIPLVGSKKSDTEAAAIASIYTPQISLAKQAANEIGNLCAGGKQAPPFYSEQYAISSNAKIAKAFGFKSLSEKELLAKVKKLERATSNE